MKTFLYIELTAKKYIFINDIANNYSKNEDWKIANPNWLEDEKLQEEYVKLMSETYYPISEDEKAEKKIIKNITKEIHLPKENITNN